ncbi:hypothetical protein OAR83_02990 [Alphaproteobacteria bacterium]|nr:hypothetical protein [Alphaproteobacteria bacterium]
MKRARSHAALSASLLGRLSAFDLADFGPHASLLYRELLTSASAGLSASTIILAAAIVDIVQHEQAGPAGYLDGAAFAYAGSTANLSWLRGRRNCLLHYEGPNDGLMGEADAGRWLAGDAERAVTALLDFLDDLRFAD